MAGYRASALSRGLDIHRGDAGSGSEGTQKRGIWSYLFGGSTSVGTSSAASLGSDARTAATAAPTRGHTSQHKSVNSKGDSSTNCAGDDLTYDAHRAGTETSFALRKGYIIARHRAESKDESCGSNTDSSRNKGSNSSNSSSINSSSSSSSGSSGSSNTDIARARGTMTTNSPNSSANSPSNSATMLPLESLLVYCFARLDVV